MNDQDASGSSPPPPPAAAGGKGVGRQLGKDTALYSLGNALTRMVGFFLIPIYTRYLTPADYGSLSLLLVLLTLVLTVSTQGIGTAFLRHVPSAKTDGERSSLLSSALAYLTLSGIVIGSAVALFGEDVGRLLLGGGEPSGPAEPAAFVRLVVLVAVLQLLSVVPMQQLVASRRVLHFLWISVVSFLAQVSLSIWFVVGMEWGVFGILLGMGAGAASTAGLSIAVNRRMLTCRVSRDTIRALVKFGLPLVPVGLCFWLIQVSDRVLLQRLAGDGELGLYSLGARFADLMRSMLIAPFSIAWGAFCFRIAEEEDARATFKKLVTHVLLAISTAGVVAMAVLPPVLKMASAESFWPAARVVPLLVCSSVLYGSFMVLDLGITVTKRTHFFPYIMIAGTLVNVGLNILFIPGYGMMGAAVASILAYVVIVVVTYVISQRIYRIDYPLGRFSVLAVLLGLAAGASCASTSLGGLEGLGVAAVIIAGFLVAAAVLGIARWGLVFGELRGVFQARGE